MKSISETEVEIRLLISTYSQNEKYKNIDITRLKAQGWKLRRYNILLIGLEEDIIFRIFLVENSVQHHGWEFSKTNKRQVFFFFFFSKSEL